MKRADRRHLPNLQVSSDSEGHFLSQQVSGLSVGLESRWVSSYVLQT